MRILFITAYAPTLIRTRPYNLLRALAHLGHRVTLATLWENVAEQRALADLVEATGINLIVYPLARTQSARYLASALLSPDPLQSRYSWHPALAKSVEFLILHSNLSDSQKRIANSSNNFAVIHAEHLRASPYGLYLKNRIRSLKPGIPIIYDSVDSISLIYERAQAHTRSLLWRWITRFELPRTRRYEARLMYEFDHVLVTSPADKSALESLAASYPPADSSIERSSTLPSSLQHAVSQELPSSNRRFEPPSVVRRPSSISVLPNGVDLAYFSPATEPRASNTIVYTGKMSYHANLSAALYLINDVMPLVWAQHPDVQVQIVGKDPPRGLLRLQISNAGRVSVLGTVPDLRPYLHRATLACAPLTYGAGIQNKVLEAMACAAPVVASPLAVSALENIVPGEHLLVGEDAREIANHILRLLADHDLRLRLAANGRAFVERHHNWHNIALQLERVYQAAIEQKQRTVNQHSLI